MVKLHFIYPCRLIIPLLVCWLPTNMLAAQDTLAFNSLLIGLQVTENYNQEVFRNYWEPEMGVEGLISMPFYSGVAHAGVQLTWFSGKNKSYPNFFNIHPFLGWGFRMSLPYRSSWYFCVRIGIDQMIFDQLEGYEKSESEVASSLNTMFSMPIHRDCHMLLSTGYKTIFTQKRIHLLQISAGMAYIIRTPPWLKGFLD
ncbi:MAG: hypothetical protein ACETWG_08015 [Candidatus Neomarinimicrobiota bacterium]